MNADFYFVDFDPRPDPPFLLLRASVSRART
jgi:hypothetical protein